MKIKQTNYEKSVLSFFDIIGTNEVALTKSLAYIFSIHPKALFRFLQSIGVSIKNTKNNFKQVSIEIERKRDEGRTDIEIHA